MILFTAFSTANAQLWFKSDKSIYLGGPTTNRNLGINIYNLPGFYWQYGNSFMKMDCTPANPRLAFSGDEVIMNGYIYAQAFRIPLNSMAVANIQTVYDGSSILNNLQPVKVSNESLQISAETKNKSVAKTVYVLNTESLEKVFPQAVKTAPNEQKYVNYTMLIPVLVSGIQELKTRIELQQHEIDSLREVKSLVLSINNCLSSIYNSESAKYILGYTLPATTKEAYLQICDNEGKQVRIINVVGTTKATILARDLNNNEGYCSLLVNGELVGTQKLTAKE